MNLAFTITYIIWLLMEVFLTGFLRAKSHDKKHANSGLLWSIWIAIIVTIFLANYITVKYVFPISLNQSIRYIGLALLIIGFIFRLISVYSLGKLFTVDIAIRPGHQLKKDGLYKYLRHPSYFASLISFIGFGICLNNRWSLLLIIIVMITVFIIRIKIEEKSLIEHFGNEYLHYKKTTSSFIPFIY